jgi:RNA polymerase sigma factor (sigma-70 family)
MINRLSQLERALILLWLEERSYQEIADIMGISKNNVAVKLNRIREKLKTMSNS